MQKTQTFSQPDQTVLIFLAMLVCLVVAEPVWAYTILTPDPEARLLIQARRPISNMVIKVKDKAEISRLRVTKEQNLDGDIQVVLKNGQYEHQDATYLHYTLLLKQGENIFIVNPGEQKLIIQFRPVRTLLNVDFEDPKAYLFHRNKTVPTSCTPCHNETLPDDADLDVARLEKNVNFSPVCFSCHRSLIQQNLWLHSPSATVHCLTCHQQKLEGKTMITTLVGRVDDVCFDCHINKKKIRTRKYVHGPVGLGDCTICHDPHGDEYKYQLWADGLSDLCIGCHTDKKFTQRKNVGFYSHGIIQGGGCTACHNPHASDNKFNLYKPINELCISCHNQLENMEQGHPVGKHPLKGKKDPRREGRELACSSCHNPHGSRFRYLLIGDILGGHVCSKCHH